MNLIKKIFSILTFLLISNVLIGQSGKKTPYLKFLIDITDSSQQNRHLANYPSLPVYLGAYFSKNNYFSLESETFQKLCVEGKSYFKFTLSSDGILKDIVAIKGTPTFFVEIFKKGIMSSKDFWRFPKEAPPHSSLDLVLPFEYSCLLGCNRGLRNEHLNVKYFPDIETNNSRFSLLIRTLSN